MAHLLSRSELLAQVTLLFMEPTARRPAVPVASRRWLPGPSGSPQLGGQRAADPRRGPAAVSDPEPQRPHLAGRRRRDPAGAGRAGHQPGHGRLDAAGRPRGGNAPADVLWPTDVMQTVHASFGAGRSGVLFWSAVAALVVLRRFRHQVFVPAGATSP